MYFSFAVVVGRMEWERRETHYIPLKTQSTLILARATGHRETNERSLAGEISLLGPPL